MNDSLIKRFSLIENEEDKVKAILSYFFENVEYDYGFYLLAKIQSGIENYGFFVSDDNWMKEYVKKVNKTDKEITVFTGKYIGESKLFEEITNIYKSCDDKINAIEQIDKYLRDILKEEFTNADLINKNINNLMNLVINFFVKENRLNENQNIAYDFLAVLLEHACQTKKYIKPVIEDGILKKGVCEDYSRYLVDFFYAVGLDAVYLQGKSELGHAWVAVKVDGIWKSVDLTRAVFIRDGAKKIPVEQTSGDWLLNDFEQIFKMQEGRKITHIGLDDNGNPMELSEEINKDNYDAQKLESLLEEYISHKKTH